MKLMMKIAYWKNMLKKILQKKNGEDVNEDDFFESIRECYGQMAFSEEEKNRIFEAMTKEKA